MIRLILIFIVIIIMAIYIIIDFVFGSLFSIASKVAVRDYRHALIRFIFKVFTLISGARVVISGLENIDEATKQNSVFIISNHRGFFDTIIGYSLLKFPCGLVAKDNLENVPVLSYWMKKIDCLFLDRRDLRSGVAMVLNAIKRLNDGISIWVFPEGTRNKNDNPSDLLEFKAGAFKIPEKANCKVLPIAFKNTEEIFENHRPFIKPAKVYVSIGKLYDFNESAVTSTEEFAKYSENKIKNLILLMKD